MDKRLLKRIAAFTLAAALSLSHAVTAFAAGASPKDYVFSMVLRACGVSPGSKVGAWQDAFEGYLEKTGNQALLNQVKSYSGLSWGSSAEGVDTLYWSVREWLSSASVQESGGGSLLYSLPSSPAPHLNKISSSEETTINTTPFSNISALPSTEAGDYVYVFSDAASMGFNGQTVYAYRNVYAPKNTELFGIITSYNDFSDNVIVTFYTPDSSSPDGYRLVNVKDMRTAYSPSDGSLVIKTTASIAWNWNRTDARSVMNYPFKVFGSAEAAKNYCKTGAVSGLFTADSMTLSSGGKSLGADTELIKWQVDSVDDTLTLPGNSAAASTNLSSLQSSMNLDSLSAALASAGMEVSYTASYKVEHYKQDVTDLDEPVTWIKMSEEFLTGTIGAAPSIEPNSYPNFLYAPELTEPQDSKILADGSLVVRLYYKPDLDAEYPYTVEYHKEGEVFKTVSGSVPMFGDRIVTSCEDFCPQYYLPDTKASTPLPFEVTEYKNTIHIYYKRDVYATFPYTVEYYKAGELFKTVPGSISVFNPSVKSCISYCPKGYVLDTTSSTSLPCDISEKGGVVKNYYVKKDTVIPYTVEYYKDGLRTKTFSGNVPSSSPVLQSCPSYCPEYYVVDSERSDSLPYTMAESGNRIRIYYKKDESAVFPYTVECYKDGELVETVSKTVSVFDPSVKEYGYDCPEGYVVDTSSSTSLPYSVSRDNNVIRFDYVDEGKSLPYTVEYYKDGKEFTTLSGNVPVTSPVVKSYWPYCPDGYIQDEESSDSLPFTVTADNNVIRAYYVPDPSNPYTSFTGGVSRLVNFVIGFLGKAMFWLFLLLMLYLFIDKNLVLVKRIISRVKSKEPKQKKKLFTAPKSKFMKGVHANKGTSLKSKANMKPRERTYFKPDLRRPRSSDKHTNWGM